VALSFVEGLVGGEGAGDEAFGEEVVHLLGTDAAAAVEGEVPGDADEPDAEVADGGELVLMCFALVLQDSDEGVLDGVFGFGAAAEDGVGDTKEEWGVVVDERREIDFRSGGLCDRQSQAASLSHVALLHGQTDGEGDRSFIFLAGLGVREGT